MPVHWDMSFHVHTFNTTLRVILRDDGKHLGKKLQRIPFLLNNVYDRGSHIHKNAQ